MKTGFVFVGINTLPRAVVDYSDINSQWRNTDATQMISLNEDLSISVDSTTELVLTAPKVTIKGNVKIDGTLTATENITSSKKVIGTEDVTGGGKSLKTHTHASGTITYINASNVPTAATGSTATPT